MVQQGSEGFAGAEARLAEQREKLPRITEYLLQGGDDELVEEVAAQIAADKDLLGMAQEAAGGLMDNQVVERMGKVLRTARAINGHVENTTQARKTAPYRRTDETAFLSAKSRRSGQATRA